MRRKFRMGSSTTIPQFLADCAHNMTNGSHFYRRKRLGRYSQDARTRHSLEGLQKSQVRKVENRKEYCWNVETKRLAKSYVKIGRFTCNFIHCSYGNCNLMKYMDKHKISRDGKAFHLVRTFCVTVRIWEYNIKPVICAVKLKDLFLMNICERKIGNYSLRNKSK